MQRMRGRLGQTGEHASANSIPVLCCLALVVANHSIFRLGAISFAWTIALIVALMAVAILGPTIELKSRVIHDVRPLNLVLGALILVPLMASLALGWNREFPFHGDHAFHNRQTRFFAHWWLSPVGSEPFSFEMPSNLIQL